MIRAYLQAVGMVSWSKEALKIHYSGRVSIEAKISSSLTGISSGPAAERGLRSLSILRTPGLWMLISFISERTMSGTDDVSWLVKTDENC